MSDYFANLAARSTTSVTSLRPRVAGMYEPNGLIVNTWFGVSDKKEVNSGAGAKRGNLHFSTEGLPTDFLHAEKIEERNSTYSVGLNRMPSRELFPRGGLTARAPFSNPKPLPSARGDVEPGGAEPSTPREQPELSRAEEIAPLVTKSFDSDQFSQENRARSNELKIAKSKDAAVSDAGGQRSLAEGRSGVSRNTTGHQSLPSLSEIPASRFQSRAPQDPSLTADTGPISSFSSDEATPPPSQTRWSNEINHEVATGKALGRVTHKKLSRIESAPVIQENMAPLGLFDSFVRSKTIEKSTEFEPPLSEPSAKSQHRPFEAILRDPRVPVISPQQRKRFTQSNDHDTDEQFVTASNRTVQVTIGRIEVRAPVPHVSGPARTVSAPKVMGLEEYLERRAGRSGK